MLAIALALAATACAAPEPGGSNTNSTAVNTNAATPAAAASPAASSTDLTAQERQVWDAIKRKDANAVGGFLADDFVYVTNTGVYDKAGAIESIKPLDLSDVTLSNFKTINVDQDLTVITYDLLAKGTAGGQPMPTGIERDSSAWANRGGRWVAVYHQDTLAQSPPGGQPANGNTNAPPKSILPVNPAPSASGTPAGGAAAASPTDMEKQVWDALKRKDFTAFGNFLADNAVEVEPEGVYDKAGSIEGVKNIDLSGATLSDFKETKFDADAALVTYLVKSTQKGFNPAGERHSTIWVNRGAGWQAVFHQATHVRIPQK